MPAREEAAREGDGRTSDGYTTDAALYAAHADESPWNRWYERPALDRLLTDDELAGALVLDAACAAGAASEQLRHRGAAVIGVDSSHPMARLALARRNGPTGVVSTDLEGPLPFADHSFDVVYSSLTVHYLADLGTAFRELARVLRPGGILVLSTHHPFDEALRVAAHRSRMQIDSYFRTGTVTEQWAIGGQPLGRWLVERLSLESLSAVRARRRVSWRATRRTRLTVRFQRRTLSQLLNPLLDAGLVLERVGEPLPSGELISRFPRAGALLRRRPGFLFLRARRPHPTRRSSTNVDR
ncbi:MAG: class I SAM-dependent methyltransferase [Acidimicrobiia bacterium]|nr:class I SAM-dependent methyltransferase [Acidimicrobiia bacterium]